MWTPLNTACLRDKAVIMEGNTVRLLFDYKLRINLTPIVEMLHGYRICTISYRFANN